ncbi:hypothetical protein C4577_04505 [Candidatus Parcubacteria bacterium]|nr:MAG: hypothetical protein C4577_04505 [Candidatus Parcubacteria bacterium]
MKTRTFWNGLFAFVVLFSLLFIIPFAKSVSSDFLWLLMILIIISVTPLIILPFLLKANFKSNNLYYLLSILTLVFIPIQQYIFGLLTLGMLGFPLRCSSIKNSVLFPNQLSWCNHFTQTTLITTILIMIPLILLAYKLFLKGEGKRANVPFNLFSIINISFGVMIIGGYLVWHIINIF